MCSWEATRLVEKLGLQNNHSTRQHKLARKKLATPPFVRMTLSREDRKKSQARIGNEQRHLEDCSAQSMHSIPLSKKYSVLALRGFSDMGSKTNALPDFPEKYYSTAAGLNDSVFGEHGTPRLPDSPRLLLTRPPSRLKQIRTTPSDCTLPNSKQTFHELYLGMKGSSLGLGRLRYHVDLHEQEEHGARAAITADYEKRVQWYVLILAGFDTFDEEAAAPLLAARTIETGMNEFINYQADRDAVLLTLRGMHVAVRDSRHVMLFSNLRGADVLAGIFRTFACDFAVVHSACQVAAQYISSSLTQACLTNSEMFSNLLNCAANCRRDVSVLTQIARCILLYVTHVGSHASVAKLVSVHRGLSLLVSSALHFHDNKPFVLIVAKTVLRVVNYTHTSLAVVESLTVRALSGIVRASPPNSWELRLCLVRIIATAATKYRKGRGDLTDQGVQAALLDSLLETTLHGPRKRSETVPPPEIVKPSLKKKKGKTPTLTTASVCSAETEEEASPLTTEGSLVNKIVLNSILGLKMLSGNSSERSAACLTHSCPLIFEALANAAGQSYHHLYHPDVKSLIKRLQTAIPIVSPLSLSLRLHPVVYSEYRPPSDFELSEKVWSFVEDAAPYHITCGYTGVSVHDGVALLVKFLLIPCEVSPPEALPHLPPVQQFTADISSRCLLWHPSLMNFACWSSAVCVPVLPGDETIRPKHYVLYEAFRGGRRSAEGNTLEDFLTTERGKAREAATLLHNAQRKSLTNATHANPPLSLLGLNLMISALHSEREACTALSTLFMSALEDVEEEEEEEEEVVSSVAPSLPAGLLTFGDLFVFAETLCSGLRYLDAAHVRSAGVVCPEVIWLSEPHDAVPVLDSIQSCAGLPPNSPPQDFVWKLQWGESAEHIHKLRSHRRDCHSGDDIAPHHGLAGLGHVLADFLMYSSETAGLMFHSCGAVDTALPGVWLNGVIAPCFGRHSLTDVTTMAAPAEDPTPTMTAAQLLERICDLRELSRVVGRFPGDPEDLPDFAAWLASISSGGDCDGVPQACFTALPVHDPSHLADTLAQWEVESVLQIPQLDDAIPLL